MTRVDAANDTDRKAAAVALLAAAATVDVDLAAVRTVSPGNGVSFSAPPEVVTEAGLTGVAENGEGGASGDYDLTLNPNAAPGNNFAQAVVVTGTGFLSLPSGIVTSVDVVPAGQPRSNGLHIGSVGDPSVDIVNDTTMNVTMPSIYDYDSDYSPAGGTVTLGIYDLTDINNAVLLASSEPYAYN